MDTHKPTLDTKAISLHASLKDQKGFVTVGVNDVDQALYVYGDDTFDSDCVPALFLDTPVRFQRMGLPFVGGIVI